VIITVPGDTAVITPVDDPIVAISVLALVHTPPVGEPVSVIELPTHTLVPVEAPIVGVWFTVIVVVT